MTKSQNLSKFANLTFNDFRELAKDQTLSRHEKVGFPDGYRDGKEEAIFNDMLSKLGNLSLPNKQICEIGPGCSALPGLLSELCIKNNNELYFVDNSEMLDLLPKSNNITKYAGAFPVALGSDFEKLAGKIDVIIAYSVIQYVFAEGNIYDFLDRCLTLLSDGGEILFGDVPNITMRKRFFSSTQGELTHRQFTNSDEKPVVAFNQVEPGQIDDSVVLALLSRARAQGFHAWVLPQPSSLPMANRREDILIRKP